MAKSLGENPNITVFGAARKYQKQGAFFGTRLESQNKSQDSC